MDMYLISLSGQGDTSLKLVDQETFEWVVSDYLGFRNDPDSRFDKTCPLNVRKKVWENLSQFDKRDFESFESFYPEIYDGSEYNDRALFAPALTIDGMNLSFSDALSYSKYITSNNVNILDEYSGYIY